MTPRRPRTAAGAVTAGDDTAGDGSGERHRRRPPVKWRRVVIGTAGAGTVFALYGAFAPGDIRSTALGYGAAATALVGVCLAFHALVAARIGTISAMAALSSAMFAGVTVVAFASKQCPVGGEGRCDAAGAAASGFSAMLVPVIIYTVVGLGAWSGRTIWASAVGFKRVGSRLWRGGRRGGDTQQATGTTPGAQQRDQSGTRTVQPTSRTTAKGTHATRRPTTRRR
jgi:hypothetical protein